MRPICVKKVFISFILVILTSLTSLSQQTLWVGQTFKFDVSSSVMGLTANVSWSVHGGYISLKGAGFYRDITVTQYFSGTATVTCEWDYKLTGNGKYTHVRRDVAITCRDNKVSIYPTSLTMSPGDKRYVHYRHQFDNQYTSNAQAYFQSSDPSICTVSADGEVIAKNPGTTYINVYSNISSGSPYCIVTVKKISPTSISIPSSLSITAGQSKKITPTLYPSNAQSSFTWHSSDNSIVSVSSDGTITANRHGTTTVTVYTDNGLSASCNVTVNKAKLKISSSHQPQLLQSGTKITLSASAQNSDIYYTLDGSNPTRNSIKYSGPITLTDNTTIKAFATNEDYIDSDIITLQYYVTDLTLAYTVPENEAWVSWNNFAYSATFNKEISKDKQFSDIKILDEHGSAIQYTAVISNKSLVLVPEEGFRYGKYEIIIPTSSVVSIDKKNSNIAINTTFSNNEPAIGIKAFDANGAHSFVVKDDGSMWAFGNNDHGELGDGTKTNRFKPVKIMDDVDRPIAGWRFGMAIKKDKSLWSWGANSDGELGDGTKTQRSKPKKIKDSIMFANAKYNSHSQAIDINGNLWVWGDNEFGNLGDGTTIGRNTPVKILSDNITYVIGGPHCAAINADNDLYMWGSNDYMQLGDGTTTYRKSPVKVMKGVKDVALSYCATTVLDINGNVFSWGNNQYGQLGTGDKNDVSKPTKILENIIKLGKYFYGGFAINANHELLVWGYPESLCWKSLGNYVLSPQVIMTDVEDIKCAYSHALIKKTDGSLWGVGGNVYGQLGVDTYETVIYEPIMLMPGTSKPISEASLIQSEVTIEEGEVKYIPFNVQPIDCGINSISWNASNDCISVHSNGLFEGNKIGTSVLECVITDSHNNIFHLNTKVNIIAKDNSVEYISIDKDSSEPVYYNIQGIRISPHHLTPGVYIKKEGQKSHKILIK